VACFSAATLFETKDGPRRADALKVGDVVLTAESNGRLVWDRIAADASHGGGMETFMEITTAAHSLHISPNHYMHATPNATPACCSNRTLKLASQVAVGDTVWVLNRDHSALKPVAVDSVTTIRKEGKYNFLLEQAQSRHFRSLVADGIVASSFTSNWRLLHSFGFEMADKLRNPLREMSLLAHVSATEPSAASEGGAPGNRTYSPRNLPLMRVLEQVEALTADCLEDHLRESANCSEPALRLKFAAVERDAHATLAPALHTAVSTLLLKLSERHLGLTSTAVIPHAVRRLTAAMIASVMSTSQIVDLVAHEVHVYAVEICTLDEGCRADMPDGHVQTRVTTWRSPSPSFAPVLVMCLLVITGLVILLTVTVAVALRRRRLQPNDEAKAKATPTPPAASLHTQNAVAAESAPTCTSTSTSMAV